MSRVLGGLVTRLRQSSPLRCASSPREPLLLAWLAWGVVAVSPGLSGRMRLRERDVGRRPSGMPPAPLPS